MLNSDAADIASLIDVEQGVFIQVAGFGNFRFPEFYV